MNLNVDATFRFTYMLEIVLYILIIKKKIKKEREKERNNMDTLIYKVYSTIYSFLWRHRGYVQLLKLSFISIGMPRTICFYASFSPRSFSSTF